MSEETPVRYERKAAAAVVTMNRPHKRNAMNAPMARGLREAMARFNDDASAHVCVLTGAGGFFCAGLDLTAFTEDGGAEVIDGPGRFAGLVDALPPKPIIAAVEGGAIGGGFEILLACDMAVAAEDAVLAMPEVSRGLFANGGGAIRLPRAMPPKRAMSMMLASERISARGALEYGLLNSLAPSGQCLDKALELAAAVAAQAPLAVQASLKVARASLAAEMAELWRINDEEWARVRNSEDAQEGPRAFGEKRPPKWSGR